MGVWKSGQTACSVPHSLSIFTFSILLPLFPCPTPDCQNPKCVTSQSIISRPSLCSHCLFYPSLTLLVHDNCSVGSSLFCPISTFPPSLPLCPVWSPHSHHSANISNLFAPSSSHCAFLASRCWALADESRQRRVVLCGRLVHAMFMATDLNRLCLAVLVSHKLAPR